jgi:hypothetical protein
VRLSGFTLLTVLIVSLHARTVSAAPMIPGLANTLPLSELHVGQLLIGELRCGACHGRKDPPHVLELSAPDLAIRDLRFDGQSHRNRSRYYARVVPSNSSEVEADRFHQ